MRRLPFLFALPLFSLSLLSSCSSDEELGNNSQDQDYEITLGDKQQFNLVVKDNVIKSPEWLAKVAKEMGENYNPSPVSGKYPYPFVYEVKYNDQTYLYVFDYFNSCYTCGSRFFSLDGTEILFNPDELSLYDELITQDRFNHCLYDPIEE